MWNYWKQTGQCKDIGSFLLNGRTQGQDFSTDQKDRTSLIDKELSCRTVRNIANTILTQFMPGPIPNETHTKLSH